jgi:hypothetical protein
MDAYAVSHLEEIDELDDGRCPYRPVRHHFGITAFGVTAWTAAAAGDRLINEHHEAEAGDGDEELYLVQSGRAAFEVDGERVDAPAGTFVYVPPSLRRTAFAEEPGTTIVAVGATAGQAYQPVGWEIWAGLRPLYDAGDYEAVVEQGRAVIEANPQYPLLFYNLACCESLTGRAADALAHLGHAIELSDRFRAYARDDGDFDPIRDDPAFAELTAD